MASTATTATRDDGDWGAVFRLRPSEGGGALGLRQRRRDRVLLGHLR